MAVETTPRTARAARAGADAAGIVVLRPGGAAPRAGADLRAHVAVRGLALAARRAGLVLHLPRRRDADRRRPQPGGRPARARQRLPPPRPRGRRGLRPARDAAVPLPRLDVRPRRLAPRRAALGARARVRPVPTGACGRCSSTRGARSSSSTPTSAPPRSRRHSASCRRRWLPAASIRPRSSTTAARATGSSRRTGSSWSRTSSSATTARSRTRASAASSTSIPTRTG